ncbi:uncharacterized protein LOC127804270 [Diospyros lotus]|uniref:uncharacterized protein LOC127804270 n=1 Tax=Diospyros lotus TaxID=55363 RepID=UPI00224DE0B7|nr:uncharacterized protein LOC127804270 [Diospyros lotus]
MSALKENPVSIAGTLIEKFQQPLDQLNSMIKITLELIQYICELTLLSDTEYYKEDIVSMGVYWAIVSAVAGYIQINLIVDNGEVALELSHLISNLSQILNDLMHHYTICKPQIG